MLTVKRFDSQGSLRSLIQVSDPSEIQYIDDDCIGDFQRGLYDDRIDKLLPMSQMTIRTATGKLVISRSRSWI